MRLADATLVALLAASTTGLGGGGHSALRRAPRARATRAIVALDAAAGARPPRGAHPEFDRATRAAPPLRSAKSWVERRRGEDGSSSVAGRNKNRARNRAREWERLGDMVHVRPAARAGDATRSALAGLGLGARAEELAARGARELLSDTEAATLLAALPRDAAAPARAAEGGAQSAAAGSAQPWAGAPAAEQPGAAAAQRPRWFDAITFGGLSVGPGLRAALSAQQLLAPLPVQAAAFQPIRARENAVVVAAPTGSGKTLAIFLPLVARLLTEPPDGERGRVGGAFRALVIAPSAELAAQHARTLAHLLEHAQRGEATARAARDAGGAVGGARHDASADRLTVALWTVADAAAARAARLLALGTRGGAPTTRGDGDGGGGASSTSGSAASSALDAAGATAGEAASAELQLATIVVATPAAALLRVRLGLSAKCWARLSTVVLDEPDALLALRTGGASRAGAGARSAREGGADAADADGRARGWWEDGTDGDDDGDGADDSDDDGDDGGGGADGDDAEDRAAPSMPSRAARARAARASKRPTDELLAIIAARAPGGFAPARGMRRDAVPAMRALPPAARAPSAAAAGPRGWDAPPGGSLRGWDGASVRAATSSRESARDAAPARTRAPARPPTAPPAQQARPVQLVLSSATVGRALRKRVQLLTDGASITDAAIVVTAEAEGGGGGGARAGGGGSGRGRAQSALMLPPQIAHGYWLAPDGAADGDVCDDAWLGLVARAWHAWLAVDRARAHGAHGAGADRTPAAAAGTERGTHERGRIGILFVRRADSVADATRALRESGRLGAGVRVCELRARPGAASVGSAGEDGTMPDAADAVNAMADAVADAQLGRTTLLVASEHRARGLDVSGVGLVLVRATAGASAAAYVHCAGRTGRAGSAGSALALLSAASAPAYARLIATLGLRLSDALCTSECPPEAEAGAPEAVTPAAAAGL
ncbi:hypothetical protein KFE25_007410 [Diacronema lutheri]|uniref:ATP-dependent RNA helicase n=1 Tax=Diacronema lutheri TaxID=2081491 RepID=A0A8J6CBL7_DIALT|nr:hypothetical protein KFE25_007410 [Diacronema lutheri]